MSPCSSALARSRSQEYKEVLNERDKFGPRWLYSEEWPSYVKVLLLLAELGAARRADQGHHFTGTGWIPACFFQLDAALTVVLSSSPWLLLFKGDSIVTIFSFYYCPVDYGVFEICAVYVWVRLPVRSRGYSWLLLLRCPLLFLCNRVPQWLGYLSSRLG